MDFHKVRIYYSLLSVFAHQQKSLFYCLRLIFLHASWFLKRAKDQLLLSAYSRELGSSQISMQWNTPQFGLFRFILNPERILWEMEVSESNDMRLHPVVPISKGESQQLDVLLWLHLTSSIPEFSPVGREKAFRNSSPCGHWTPACFLTAFPLEVNV